MKKLLLKVAIDAICKKFCKKRNRDAYKPSDDGVIRSFWRPKGRK